MKVEQSCPAFFFYRLVTLPVINPIISFHHQRPTSPRLTSYINNRNFVRIMQQEQKE